MRNPLVIFITARLTAFFGLCWIMLAGNWLGLSAFSREHYLIAELLPLAYGGAILSTGFITAIILVKLNRTLPSPARKIK